MSEETGSAMTVAAKQPRAMRGRFSEKTEVAERDAEVRDLLLAGYSQAEICARLGMDSGSVSKAKARILETIRRPPTGELLDREVERLEASLRRYEEMEQTVRGVMERKHITVSNGRAIYDETGEPVIDDEMVLKSVDRLAKIEAQRTTVAARLAHLLGLNQPVKTEISGSLTYEIVGLGD